MRSHGLDSRRSWIVAVACFFVQILTFGLTSASGLLYVATIGKFNSSREETSLPYTLAYCVRCATGPLVSYLGQKYGMRQVTLFGAVLSAISVGACFFANDIMHLTLLWGLVFGISFGMETSLLNVILNEHFLKNRVKANALNISGSSIGVLLLSPLIENTVEAYGLSGTFLIISGLMLNSIPACMLMLLIKPSENGKESLDLPVKNSLVELNKCDKSIDYMNESYRKRTSDIPEMNLVQSDVPKDTINFDSSPNGEILKNEPYIEGDMPKELSCVVNEDLKNQNESFVHVPSNSSTSTKWKIYLLFCEPIYIVLLIGSAIYYFAIVTFLTIIVDRAIDIGISLTYSTYILMWLAVSDMCGYFTLSWFVERFNISLTKFAAFSYLCLCLMSIGIVWSKHYIMLIILATIFEFGQCGVYVLCAPVVAKLIDEDLQATALASVTILSSPMTMAISPIIGYFRDGEGTYDGVFYVISAATFVCCVLFLFLPKLQRRRNSRRTKT